MNSDPNNNDNDEKSTDDSQESSTHHEDVIPFEKRAHDDVENPSNDAVHPAEAQLLYLRAEFDNYKKRILRDQEQSVRFANESIVRDLLSIVDLFDRALDSATPLKNDKASNHKEMSNFLLGIEMTQRELVNLLERFGVKLLGTPGDKFDPEIHEAISQVDDPSAKQETIANVVNRGCKLHDRLVQPAKVVVSKPTS